MKSFAQFLRDDRRHTPETVADGGEVVAMAIVQGELISLEEQDNVLAIENWRTSLTRYLESCADAAIMPKDITSSGRTRRRR